MADTIPTWSREQLEQAVVLPPPPADREVYVRIRGLHRHFGPRHILRGIDLDVYRGETVVILGLSGSGKTTLFNHLMGSLGIESGAISVAGIDLARLDRRGWYAYRRNLGVVFQGAALLGSLNVLENVGLPLVEVERRPAAEVRSRVVKALRRVFLPAEEILDLKPASLSGGMRKRVGIARAIIQEPQLLLYDEPTTGLDPVSVTGVGELVRELQTRLGVTSLIISHDLQFAFTVADRIALLYQGRIVALGDGEHIRNSPHPVLRQLLTGATQGPLTEEYLRQ